MFRANLLSGSGVGALALVVNLDDLQAQDCEKRQDE
jgi:hypothetical protein